MDPRAGELWLKPLCADHAEKLARQYRSPAIARLSELPPLNDPTLAKAWIQHRLAQPLL